MAAKGPTREEQARFMRECLAFSCQSMSFQQGFIPGVHLCKVSAFGIVGTGSSCGLCSQWLYCMKVCTKVFYTHIKAEKSKGKYGSALIKFL